MGNNTVIKNSKNTFIEQLKIDYRSENKVLGIYINPHEFPQSGLIIISNKSKKSFNLKEKLYIITLLSMVLLHAVTFHIVE